MGYLLETEHSNHFFSKNLVIQSSFLIETTPPLDAQYCEPERIQDIHTSPITELKQEKSEHLLEISEKAFVDTLGKDKAEIAIYLQERLKDAQLYTDEQEKQKMEKKTAIDTLVAVVDTYQQRSTSLEIARLGIKESPFVPRIVQKFISRIQSKRTERSIRQYEARIIEEEKRLGEMSSSERIATSYRDEFAMLLSTFMDGDAEPVLTWFTKTIRAKLSIVYRPIYKTEFSGFYDTDDALIEAYRLTDFVQLLNPVEGNRLRRACDEAREVQKNYQWW